MPPKRKSARLAEMKSAEPTKKVRYTYDSDIDDDSDVESISDASEEIEPDIKLDPQEIERVAEIAIKDAQDARAIIRDLLEKLPKDESKAILAVLEEAESYDQPGARYTWAKLPAEVKNLIFKYTFVADKPVKPHVWYPNIPERRRVQKYQLGANFLRCSKEIYAQGRPILLGQNHFEITNQFRSCVGADKNRKNSSMIRKVIIRSTKASSAVLGYIYRMQSLQEMTIINDHCYWNSLTEEAWAMSFSSVKHRLKLFLHRENGPTVFFVTEGDLKSEMKSNGLNKDNTISLRFRVDWVNANKPAEGVGVEKKVYVVGDFKLTLVARKQFWSATSSPCYYGYPQAMF